MDYLYLGKLFNNGFVLLVVIRINVFSFFKCIIKSLYLVYESKSLYLKITDLVMISYTLELIIY
jgi:hypothetical protein